VSLIWLLEALLARTQVKTALIFFGE